MLAPGRQFLPSRLVYGTKIGQSVAWLLQRLETLGLGLQFLPCSVVYSPKTAKIGLSVRVVVAKIGDDGPRTPIFAITCYLQFGRSVHVVLAKIGDAGPRTPIFGVTCYLQREAYKDWPVSPRGPCEYWR